MPELPDPVVYAVPGFILLLLVEMIVSLRRDKIGRLFFAISY